MRAYLSEIKKNLRKIEDNSPVSTYDDIRRFVEDSRDKIEEIDSILYGEIVYAQNGMSD